MTAIQLTQVRQEVLADTRMLADQLGIQRASVFKMVNDYRSDFEQLGILRFQIGEIQGRGQPEKFALLNEDQCYLLLTFSRNTAKVRQLKVNLVLAFKNARSNSYRRSTAQDRALMAHKTIDIALDRRVSPSTVQGAVNRWVGVRRSRYMTMQQLSDGLGFCGRLADRSETQEDWRRIEDHSVELYGHLPQLSLIGVSA